MSRRIKVRYLRGMNAMSVVQERRGHLGNPGRHNWTMTARTGSSSPGHASTTARRSASVRKAGASASGLSSQVSCVSRLTFSRDRFSRPARSAALPPLRIRGALFPGGRLSSISRWSSPSTSSRRIAAPPAAFGTGVVVSVAQVIAPGRQRPRLRRNCRVECLWC